MRERRRLIPALLILALACTAAPQAAKEAAGTPAQSPQFPRPTAPVPYDPRPGALLLRVSTGHGGLRSPFAVHVPDFSLFGDGRIVVESSARDDTTYPESLPNLAERRTDEDGIQEILAESASLGLTTGQGTIGRGSSRAGWATFVLRTGGVTRTTTVRPFPSGAESSPVQVRLGAFFGRLMDSSFPAPLVEAERPYAFFRIRVTSNSLSRSGTPQRTWPLDALTRIDQRRVRGACDIVEGGRLKRLLASLQEVHDYTEWVSDGRRYVVMFRPLLPDEDGCTG